MMKLSAQNSTNHPHPIIHTTLSMIAASNDSAASFTLIDTGLSSLSPFIFGLSLARFCDIRVKKGYQCCLNNVNNNVNTMLVYFIL